ncbi:hypothetical protein JM946_20470 [Steroidobacter sp. S1-65]|uniref:Uncharacterized protein n=1 Tax=Steroidobacter gossypii TaxID=2805490 RepID=A0ABS1X1K4_9GAMM|nr:hypothetical protein [Steroidobacter gossypii]MBM0107117.1 hypothetical protein [Steroidobacter gossypii]
MNVKQLLRCICASTLLAAHVAGAEDAPAAASPPADTVFISKSAPFLDEGLIAKNIIEECGLPESQIKLLREKAEKSGVSLSENEAAVAGMTGKVLALETTNAISSGNAFVGHRKQVAVRGKLFDNGAEIGNFLAIRNSMGGIGAGFIGSCAVLYRCQGAIAEDILKWLKNPIKDARLGDQ